MGLREATLKEQFWFLRSRIPSYLVTWLSSSPTDLTFDQTTSPGGFFVFRARDYDCNDRITRRSFTQRD
ncbi:TPA_asm: hypothetical protein GDL67_22305 [Salmonella enterica]|nr:hypothetical protein [Salmonella enterica]